MSEEMDRLLARNANAPENQCMLTNAHLSHYWWYTSSGGGHMLADITEADLRTEKNLKRHWCPGIRFNSASSQKKPRPDEFGIGTEITPAELQMALRELGNERVIQKRKKAYDKALDEWEYNMGMRR